jgi:hypothetical protein
VRHRKADTVANHDEYRRIQRYSGNDTIEDVLDWHDPIVGDRLGLRPFRERLGEGDVTGSAFLIESRREVGVDRRDLGDLLTVGKEQSRFVDPGTIVRVGSRKRGEIHGRLLRSLLCAAKHPYRRLRLKESLATANGEAMIAEHLERCDGAVEIRSAQRAGKRDEAQIEPGDQLVGEDGELANIGAGQELLGAIEHGCAIARGPSGCVGP